MITVKFTFKRGNKMRGRLYTALQISKRIVKSLVKDAGSNASFLFLFWSKS